MIQRANLAYGDFIRSQEGMTFNGQVSRGVRTWKAEDCRAGRPGPPAQPGQGSMAVPSPRPSSGPRPPPLQVCLIGDCVGGILAFDALCCSNQPVSESQSSSRRGSVASVQVPRMETMWPFGPKACGEKGRTEVTGAGARRAGQCVGSQQLQQVVERGPCGPEQGLGRVASVTRCHHLSSPAGESTKGPSAANGLWGARPLRSGRPAQARREAVGRWLAG